MNGLHILILALATWRLSSLLAMEDGPYQVFHKLRLLTGVEYRDGGVHPRNELARGLVCLYCNSVWIGALATVLYLTIGIEIVWVALPLALSALAIIVSEKLTG